MTTEQPTPAALSNPLDEYVAAFATAIEEWKQDHTPESIKKSVFTRLDKQAEQLVFKLLGFDDRWGKWEVDHCNGRAGNSAAGEYLRSIQQEAIQAWFQQLQLPSMAPKLQKALEKYAEDHFNSVLREQVREQVTKQATELATKLVSEILSTKNHDAYFKLKALIST